jgi:type IV secretion system protein TrbF
MGAESSSHSYLAAQQEINGRLATHIKGKRNWQLIAGGLLLSTIISNAGTVYVSQQQQIVPILVPTDTALTVAAYQALRPTMVQDPTLVAEELRRFIYNLRLLTTDEKVRKDQRNRALGQCLSNAQNYLRQYYATNPIGETMKQGAVYVDNIEVWPASKESAKSWRATWREQVQDEKGVKAESQWEADIQVVFISPKTAAEIQASRFGIWIEQIHISPRSA